MTDSDRPALVVATIKSCGQHRVRVELPGGPQGELHQVLSRRALRETTETFIDCTRNYQSVAWVGIANLAFAESRTAPSDRKSKFLHPLYCLKLIEIAVAHFRAQEPDRAPGDFRIGSDIRIPREFAAILEILCEKLGVVLMPPGDAPDLPADSPLAGVVYRGTNKDNETFAPGLVRWADAFTEETMRKLAGRTRMKRLARFATNNFTRFAWIYHSVGRAAFHLYYGAIARRVMKASAGGKPVFLYCEVRSGRSRDVDGYLTWKYGKEFLSGLGKEYAPVPFTHLALPDAPFSFSAMKWALRSLRRMEKDCLDGCVVANFLLTPTMLWKLHGQRQARRLRISRRLRELSARNSDFITGLIYEEFRVVLKETNAYAMELAKSYQRLFAAFPPGALIQADALAKGARQYTACVRRRGGKAIYLADRICTDWRTSNQLIADGGENPHFPDRCVVFDRISKQELVRQGFHAGNIIAYQREMGAGLGHDRRNGRPTKILVLLQDYMDNLSVMLTAGAEVARCLLETEVIFQEHPNYPVSEDVRARLRSDVPGRLRFLAPGEKAVYEDVLAMITGYSTAAFPGVLQGVPLIWLRGQVDNSIYGEAYLKRIGFAADDTAGAMQIIRSLLDRDRVALESCAASAESARDILSPSGGPGKPLAAALDEAVRSCFSEIAGEPVNVSSFTAQRVAAL